MTRKKESSGRRLRWCCCTGCGVSAVAGVVFGLLLLSPPPRPPQLSAAQHAVAVQKAAEVKQQVQSIAQDARQGRSRDFSVEIGQNELNELVQTDGDLQQAVSRLRISDPYVVIDRGSVRLTATRDVGGVDLTSTVSVRPRLDADGRVEVSVESAHVGRLSVPDALTRRFADRLAESISQKANSGRVRIRSLQVVPGRISIEGSTVR